MISVGSVKHIRKKGNALTLEQQKYFIEIIKDNKLEYLYKFYLLSGCRRGEALSIKWTDIDYTNNRIHIRGTKTDGSDRYIPLFGGIQDILKHIKKGNDYLFPFSENLVHCNFKRLKDKYNLNYRIHDLRHTFATRCLEKGISMKIIQKWLGHSKLDTTANIYTHVLTSFELEETTKFNINF